MLNRRRGAALTGAAPQGQHQQRKESTELTWTARAMDLRMLLGLTPSGPWGCQGS